jgi:hypothetical protein
VGREKDASQEWACTPNPFRRCPLDVPPLTQLESKSPYYMQRPRKISLPDQGSSKPGPPSQVDAAAKISGCKCCYADLTEQRSQATPRPRPVILHRSSCAARVKSPFHLARPNDCTLPYYPHQVYTPSVALILYVIHPSQPGSSRIYCFLANIPLRVIQDLHQALQNLPLQW